MIFNTRWARLLAFFFTIAMLLPVASVFAQTPTFATTEYPLLGNNHVAADFNGDGSLDLAGTGLPRVTIRLNNGDGTFGAAVDYPTAATPNSAQDLAAGDFNGDGRLDLVVTLNDQITSLSLLTGNGDGTFNAPVNFPNTSGFGSPAVAAVDLNNDAKLDVVIAHDIACFTAPCVNTDLMSVMMGNGDGTFQPSREIEVGRGMSEIAVGDFNRDGIRDLAIAGTQGSVYLLDGVGDGTFVQRPTMVVVVDTFFIPATDIDVADFNGDAIEDLVVAVPHNGSRTAITLGNGDGTFRTPTILTGTNHPIPQQQAVADYNGDGFPDLALANGDGSFGIMEIRNGNGDGTFQAGRLYLPPPPQSIGGINILSANLNGDGKPDIALLRGGAFPAFLVLINTTGVAPPPTPAAPTLLSPANGATVSQPVTLDWNNVANATSYEVQVDSSSTIAVPFIANPIVAVSQTTLGSLPAQRLWWRVRARNSAGVFGPFSATRRFTAQSAPTALSSITLSPTSVVGGNTSQGTAILTGAAPSGGAVVTLSSSNPSTAMVPTSITIAAGATSASFGISTVSVSTSTAATVIGAYGGATQSATLTVTPPPPRVTPASLFVSPATVEGGNPVTGTVFLSAGAPAGGLVVSLSSSNTAAAIVPATVTIHLSSGTFPVSTLVAAETRSTTITASANGVSRTATLTVNGSAAPPPGPTPSDLSLSPATVQGGNSSTGIVTLSAAAPIGGAIVSLSDNSTAATIPASVTVPAGATSAAFTVTTTAVAAAASVTITATLGGASRSATLTVNPATANVTLTVTATGRSGERVTSSPAGINVAVGSTQSAGFTANSSITLSVSNGRDAIWSGACSSGGNKTRTCTFTINGNASVTGNVQ